MDQGECRSKKTKKKKGHTHSTQDKETDRVLKPTFNL